MDQNDKSKVKILPPEFRPVGAPPSRMSIQEVMRMKERLKELAKGGKTFSVRDIMTLRSELLSPEKDESKPSARPTIEITTPYVDRRKILLEKMRMNRMRQMGTTVSPSTSTSEVMTTEQVDRRASFLQKLMIPIH